MSSNIDLNEIQDFINMKSFVIVISTNLNPTYQHETVALAYNIADIINARYSEFWSKHGGYKENLILFPNNDIKISSDNNENNVILYHSIKDYEKYLNKIKHEDENNGTAYEDEHYDPNHMYYRYYNFGTCVEKSPLYIYWKCKWNDINVDGWKVRDINFMKQFGTVITFEDLIYNILLLYKNKELKVKPKIEPPIQIKITTEEQYKIDNYDNLKKLLDETNEKCSQKIQEIEKIYSDKLKEERKTRKIEIDREKTITNRVQRNYKELNEKYKSDIEKYEDKIHELELELMNNDNVEENEFEKEIKKEVKKENKKENKKNIMNEMLLFIVVISLIINAGFTASWFLNN